MYQKIWNTIDITTYIFCICLAKNISCKNSYKYIALSYKYISYKL